MMLVVVMMCTKNCGFCFVFLLFYQCLVRALIWSCAFWFRASHFYHLFTLSLIHARSYATVEATSNGWVVLLLLLLLLPLQCCNMCLFCFVLSCLVCSWSCHERSECHLEPIRPGSILFNSILFFLAVVSLWKYILCFALATISFLSFREGCMHFQFQYPLRAIEFFFFGRFDSIRFVFAAVYGVIMVVIVIVVVVVVVSTPVILLLVVNCCWSTVSRLPIV